MLRTLPFDSFLGMKITNNDKLQNKGVCFHFHVDVDGLTIRDHQAQVLFATVKLVLFCSLNLEENENCWHQTRSNEWEVF